MFRHLKAVEFIDLIDGLSLPMKRVSHLNRCSECRRTFESIRMLHDDMAGTTVGEADGLAGDIDWDSLRSSVRDRLLSRAVKRSSVVQRWTGQSLNPAAAWSLTLIFLVSLMAAGGFWHYHTAHIQEDLPGRASQAEIFADSVSEDALVFGDPAGMEIEAMAWAQTDIFMVLSELDSNEEEVLRDLIALAGNDFPPLIEEN